MDLNTLDDSLKTAGIGGFAGLAVIAARKFWTFLVLEKNSNTATDAETAVIQMLRSEIDRLSAANADLAAKILEVRTISDQLRNEVSDLRLENATLKANIQALQSENMKLKSEVESLKP